MSRPSYHVHLVDEATIVDRGEQVRVWFIPFRDTWIRAKEHPASELADKAEGRDRSCPPGTVWRQEIELRLPVGTPLLSRVTSPLIERMQPIEYLTRERRGVRRHVKETWFQVRGNYQLKKITEPEEFARARKAHRAADSPPRKETGTQKSR